MPHPQNRLKGLHNKTPFLLWKGLRNIRIGRAWSYPWFLCPRNMKTRLDDLAGHPLQSRMWGSILTLSLFPPPHSSWKTDQRESEEESVESLFSGISTFASHLFIRKGEEKLARHLLKMRGPSLYPLLMCILYDSMTNLENFHLTKKFWSGFSIQVIFYFNLASPNA